MWLTVSSVYSFWLPGLFMSNCELASHSFSFLEDSSVKGHHPDRTCCLLLACCPAKSVFGLLVGWLSEKQKA